MNEDEGSEIVSITEAGRRLACSVRTIQRRLDSGALEAVEVEGQRRVRLPSDNATGRATGDAPSNVTGRQRDAPQYDNQRDSDAPQGDSKHELQGDTTRQDGVPHNATGRHHDATQRDSDARVIELLERENAFLKSQIEQANRQAAEAHAALRAALAAMPKALTQAASDATPMPQQSPQSVPDRTPATSTPDSIPKPTQTQKPRANYTQRGFRGWLLRQLFERKE